MRLTTEQAATMLTTRDRLRENGVTDRELGARIEEGTLTRLRRGRYTDTARRDALWNEDRHLLDVVALAQVCRPPGPVFLGASAAVLHGLPLYRYRPSQVHAFVEGRRHTRARAGVHWHDVSLRADEITVVDGLRCSTLDRTVLDIAASLPMEAAVAAADAALRRIAVADGRRQDPDIADLWRGLLSERAARVSTRGIRQARSVIAFADGRAQLPGESVSRLQLHRLGYTSIELQTLVVGPRGEDYWLDFDFARAQVFGEFDGQSKYLDPELRGDRSIEEVVLAEKRREDIIRGVTGRRIVRWDSSHITTPDALAARLSAFGLRPS